MKFAPLFVVALAVCAFTSSAKAVFLQESRVDLGGGLEQITLTIVEDDASKTISGINAIITAPAGTIHHETAFGGAIAPLFQSDLALAQTLSPAQDWVGHDTYWKFNEADLLVVGKNSPRNAPFAAFDGTAEKTTTTLSPNVDYLSGSFSLLGSASEAPFTHREVAQIVVAAGTQLNLLVGEVGGFFVTGQPYSTDRITGIVSDNVPEPTSLAMVMLGSLAMIRRRRVA